MLGERDLASGVVQLSNLLNRRLGLLLEKAKITPQQWLVLSALATETSAVTLVSLARRLMVTKQNMTGMIRRLEQMSLAEREGDPNDLRASRIQLTRRGRSLVERLRPSYDQWLQSLAPADEIEAITQAIERLIRSIED